MLLFPFCKINIGLDILRRRPDAFHDIETVMLPVEELCDSLEIIRMEDGGADFTRAHQRNKALRTDSGEFCFTSSGLPVDCPPEDNLVLRACRLMKSEFGIGGVKIHLHKAIPTGAGLGGGSADAAFTVMGLNEIFSLGLDVPAMEAIASKLGSDAPFFIRETTQLCTGRGEACSPFRLDLSGKYLLIVKPSVAISTAVAYAGVIPAIPLRPLSTRIMMPIETWKDNIANDFEKTLFEAYPTLGRVKSSLYEDGALYASMSGSGSALYGIFDHPPKYKPRAEEFIFCARL